jgi:hypothetical protein
MRGLLIAAALTLCGASSAVHADCRSTLGGVYAFAHNGLKASGLYHSGLAYFGIASNGAFSLYAWVNVQNVGVQCIEGGPSTWQWVKDSPCQIHFGDGPGDTMYGIVSSDGNTIVIATFPPADGSPSEYMSGTAVRTDP